MTADPQAGLRLAAALWRFWLMRGYLAEGYRWLVAALAAAPEHTAVRAHALQGCLPLRRCAGASTTESTSSAPRAWRSSPSSRTTPACSTAVEVSAAYRAIVSSEEEIEELLGAYEADRGSPTSTMPGHRPGRRIPAESQLGCAGTIRAPAAGSSWRSSRPNDSRPGNPRRYGRSAHGLISRGVGDPVSGPAARGHGAGRAPRRARGGARLHPHQPRRGGQGRGRLRPRRRAHRGEHRPLPPTRGQPGRGLRPKRSREPGPHAAETSSAAGPCSRRASPSASGSATGAGAGSRSGHWRCSRPRCRRCAGRAGGRRAGPRLVHRERRPGGPQRCRAESRRESPSAPRTGPGRAHICEAAAAILGGMESMHAAGLDAGGPLSPLRRGRARWPPRGRWLDQARQHFDRCGGQARDRLLPANRV